MNSRLVSRKLCGCFLFLAFIALLFSDCSSAKAQVAGGTVLGTVSDPSGGVISGAEITIKDIATGVVRQAASNSSGFYLIPNLPAGRYDLRISAPGFSVGTASGITLTVGAEQTLDIVLKVCAASS